MSDPRENCPWKCNHCLCYQGEIDRLTSERRLVQKALNEVTLLAYKDGVDAVKITDLLRGCNIEPVSAIASSR